MDKSYTFKVCNLTDNCFALENVLIHNSSHLKEQSELFLTIDGVVYRSIFGNVEKGKIGVGFIQRIHHNLTLDSNLLVRPYQIKDVIVNSITIKLSFRKKQENILSIHKDDFKEYLTQRFKKHYFFPNQKLIFDYNKFLLVGQIVSHGEGFVDASTELDLYTEEINLNIVDSSLLSRELFREDFDFEKIGIGGLNKELIGIFRRALSSRGIKQKIVDKLGIKHVKGIMLHGPPGTGKTLIARNIGKLLTNNEPTIINGPEILNKYVGQSEENLRNIFNKAKQDKSQLHIFIFDEIDAICKKRGRSGTQSGVTDSLVNQLLTILDGVNALENIFVIAMTNRIDLIDNALIRPGRIEILVKIGLPDYKGRMQIFRIHTERMRNNHMMGDIDFNYLASKTENFSGAEIESVVKNASSYAIHELLRTDKTDIDEIDIVVTMNHLDKALQEIKPAFGSNCSDLENLLPTNFTFQTNSHKLVYKDIINMLTNMQRFKTILINGESGSGKSTLVTKIATDSKIVHTKMIRPIDVIRMNEYEKSAFITDTLMDAYISDTSLIILDDIEVLINYADLGYNISFSNKLYQTLATILKTPSNDPNNKLMIIVTCNNDKLKQILMTFFDKCYSLERLTCNDVATVSKNIGLSVDLSKLDPNEGLTIKELLNISQ